MLANTLIVFPYLMKEHLNVDAKTIKQVRVNCISPLYEKIPQTKNKRTGAHLFISGWFHPAVSIPRAAMVSKSSHNRKRNTAALSRSGKGETVRFS